MHLVETATTIATGIKYPNVYQITLIGLCSVAIIGLLFGGNLKGKMDRFVRINPFAFNPRYFSVFPDDTWGRYVSVHSNRGWVKDYVLRSKRAADSKLTDSFEPMDRKVTYRYLKTRLLVIT